MSARELDYAKVKAYADKIMVMIRDDAREGVHPYTVRTFSALHDRCDANMYLEHAGQDYDGSEYSIREINAVQEEVQQRLMAGEVSGRRSYVVTWNVVEQHQGTFTENQLRDLFEIDPADAVSLDTLTDPDEAIQALEARGDTWHSDYGREVQDVEEAPDRELTADEVAAVGLDSTGRDGHHAFPYRWSSLAEEQLTTLRSLGGSATTAAEGFTDKQAYLARLNAENAPLTPEVTFADVQAAAKEYDPDDVADLVAHDAAVGLPGFTRVEPVEPPRGSMQWAERVMLGGTPAQRAVKQAAAHTVVLALTETTDDLGDAATTEAIVQGVAHAILPTRAMLNLITAVQALRRADAAGERLQADLQARAALDKALQLLGVTE